MSRVVITGMGAISTLGENLDDISRSLQEERCGIVFSQDRVDRGFRSPLMTTLPDVDLKQELDRKARKFMPEAAILVALATNRAILSADLQPEDIAREDVGVVVGNDSSCAPLPELMATLDKYGESHFLGSNMVIKVMNSTASMNLGPMLGAKGINLTISAACASGAHSIGLGYQLIKSGQQRMVFTGGTQEINWLAMVSFDALNSFSVRTDEPHQASRPFDKDRDGLVPGGGGAMLILESLDSASARNAQIYGEILAYGFSSDGDHLTLPSGGGAQRAMQATLAAADLGVADIDYISAHATSTPLGDAAEASAINSLFGENGPPVASTKGMTGHECWMAGASEAIYACLMMRDGFLAANTNFEEQEEGAAKINVMKNIERGQPRTILSNSFGFGGTNASLILRHFPQ